jgi:hypothetical protein
MLFPSNCDSVEGTDVMQIVVWLAGIDKPRPEDFRKRFGEVSVRENSFDVGIRNDGSSVEREGRRRLLSGETARDKRPVKFSRLQCFLLISAGFAGSRESPEQRLYLST